METRNTKQKEKILDVMNKEENMIHPTIQDIIRWVIEKDSSIGQATIYRNVNKLVEEHTLLKISTKEGYHYDINTNIHGHLSCQKCGKIIDLYDDDYQKLITKLEKKYLISIKENDIVFDGICQECNNN